MSDSRAPYWQRTLRRFAGLNVRVVLTDGRQKAGLLREREGRFIVQTAEGPSAVPVVAVASVEAT